MTANRPPDGGGMRTLTVSRTTARFLNDGHPWVRPDRFTRGLEVLETGEPVTLIDESGKRLASALADPANEVCARVYHRRADMPFVPAQALTRAWDKRATLHTDPETTCYRVVHGEADFLPGIRIERYGDVWVVLVLAGCAGPYADALCASIAGRVLGATVVRRDHRDDLRREEVRTRRFGGGDLDPEAVIQAKELGIIYPLRPFAGLATGIYVDQRATRAWLRPQASGKRVLNLFAYTGAFSISLLAAGAAHAIDVDLAAPALRRAEETAALNGVADRHRTVHADCRQFLAACSEQFDLIIADPPTAAQGGDSWVLRRDYPDLLRLAAGRLAPGGLLVACCNTIGGKPYPLIETVRQAATAAGVTADDVTTPDLGEDIPPLRGFPEGRPYRLMAVRAAP